MRTFILLLIAAVLFSFISVKKFTSPKITVPPGTVLLKEGLYMDKEEVSNAAWREFVADVEANDEDTLKYKKMIPDSTVWYSLKIDADRYIKNYYTSSTFQNYPVVGISYEQAVAFCEWRSERVNELLQKTPGATLKKVEYRLPTEAEWQLAAYGKLDTAKYPYGYEQTKLKIKGGDTVKMFNCYYHDLDSLSTQLQPIVMPVDFGKPNQYGIFNMIGNVAEMVTEKGLAKGGFYDLPLEYCKIKEQSSYKSPNRYLGFRCACTVDNNFSSKQQKEAFKKEKPTKKEKGKKKGEGVEQEQ